MSESLFNKVASLRPATLFKRRLWHRCFPLGDCFYRFPMSYRKETFITFYDFSVKVYQCFNQGVEQDSMVCFMYCFFFYFQYYIKLFSYASSKTIYLIFSSLPISTLTKIFEIFKIFAIFEIFCKLN